MLLTNTKIHLLGKCSFTRHKGLWRMDRDEMGHEASFMLAAYVGGKERMTLVHHCRMGHMAFDKMF
jgi:hypothetical protein